MDFYIQKIHRLSDDKLKQLLQLRNDENLEIMKLAENEAIKRGIDPGSIAVGENKPKSRGAVPKKEGDVNWMGVLVDLLSGL